MTKRIKRKASLKKPLHLPRKSVPAPPPVNPFKDEPGLAELGTPPDPYKAPEQLEPPWETAAYTEPELPQPVAKGHWWDFLNRPL